LVLPVIYFVQSHPTINKRIKLVPYF